jgi:ABC-2 type transport system ATP-binding protein
MTTVIKINDLSKTYESQHVLKKLNWQIEQGDIIGLLGKNGTGKSTLLKSILNMSSIDTGTISIFDEDHADLSAKTKARIAYVPQENDEIPWLSVNDLIQFRKQFYRVWSDEKVKKLVERWDIDLNKKIEKLSPGQVHRVLIILALAPMPELIIFDEPAAALDPAGRRAFLKEIVALASEDNITIIFSTHITSDLERVANKVAILNQGHICYFADLDDTKENVVRLSIHQNTDEQMIIPNLLRSTQRGQKIHCVVSELDQVWLSQNQGQGIEISVNPMGLEDIFLELTA